MNDLLLVAGTIAAAWLMVSVRRLPAAPEVPEVPSTTIVIPARNEAATLPVLLASVASLDPGPVEVIVVDDDSADDTAEVARRFGAEVVRTSGPPRGWLGKPWACQQGAERATGDLLLFLDADVELAPDALARLVAARDAGGGILSVAPHHRPAGTVENLSSWFNLVTTMASGAFTGREPRRCKVAFGPCLLVDRHEYVALGGHGAVCGDVVEDLALAGVFRAAGRPVRARAGSDTVTYRMYAGGLGPLLEGWTKNIATGASRAGIAAVLASVLWVVAALIATVTAVEVVVSDRDPWWLLAWLVIAVEAWWMLRRIGHFRWWTWAVFPIPLALFVAVFVRSLWAQRVRGRVAWRGRVIAVRSGGP